MSEARGLPGVVRMTTLAVVLGGLLMRPAAAQKLPTAYPELRADGIFGRGSAAQMGGGLVFPMGIYVRTSVDAAGGATWRDGRTSGSGRADVIARFLLDPLREVPVGLSLGGGVSVPYVSGDRRVRAYLTTVLDLEGRARGSWTPAVQVGLGGGARIGVVLRGSPSSWR